ncbi:MAG: hypothetical protein IPP85_14145 [Propionivibrio sp.]|nr:hypothetical protein [Propionivibrio sp.]
MKQRRAAMERRCEQSWQAAAERTPVVSKALLVYGLMASLASSGAAHDLSLVQESMS